MSVIFSVEGNQVVACSLNLSEELPIFNRKCTTTEKTAYLALTIFQPEPNVKILSARKKSLSGWNWALPLGAIVHLIHITGSHKNVHHKYIQLFLVVRENHEGVLKDLVEGHDVKYTTTNLRPIDLLDEKVLVEAEAEIKNQGLLLSRQSPVKTLWHYWVKMKIASAPQPSTSPATAGPQSIDQEIQALEKLIAEKERELVQLKAKLEELKRLKAVPGRVASVVAEVKEA
jgi:hypothetical protein